MLDGDLIPPIGYGWGWLVLGIALVICVLAFILVLIFVRRRVSTASANPAPLGGIAATKERYHAQITAIETDFVAGAISARQAYHRLSALVRSFGRDVSGVNAPMMTLTDLQLTRLPEITTAVAEYYPSSFAQPEDKRIAPAVTRARRVIDSWVS